MIVTFILALGSSSFALLKVLIKLEIIRIFKPILPFGLPVSTSSNQQLTSFVS